jgi:hypothetical protein
LPAGEPTFHFGRSIVNTNRSCPSSHLQPEQRLLELEKATLERLLLSCLHPEFGFPVGAVLSHVVYHQLSLASPAKSPHNQRLDPFVCRMIAELSLDLVV